MSKGWTIGGAIGAVSGLIGIYVFFHDEITARLFPDEKSATKADIKEQFQLSEERISAVVAASVAEAIGKAQSKGENISQDVKVDYEAALTKLLTSDDPALNDAKFLAVTGDAEAAAENILTVASAPAGLSDTVQAKSRAVLLRNAGDILVPSDAEKALAAYEKALELDPGNQVLQTRILKLKEATAKKNDIAAIPGATFSLGGLEFEFEGCDQPQASRCVFTVMNPTPEPISLYVGSPQRGIDETGVWVRAGRQKIAANSRESWSVPSLESSEIEISFGKPANIYQMLRFNFSVDNVNFNKEFRDIAVRGGKQVEVKAMRPIDPAHPEYAYEIDGVKIHFLGCSNPDAPICRFDMINTGKEDVEIESRGAAGYTSQSVRLNSAKSVLSLERDMQAKAPPGIVFTWEVSFNSKAALFQSFWPDLRIDFVSYPLEFRNVLIGDTPPQVKTPRYDEAASDDSIFDQAGLKFVFLGCRNPLTPTCAFDVQNTTDKALRVDMQQPKATLADGAVYKAHSGGLEMSSDNSVLFPAGLTTTYEFAFRNQMTSIDTLSLDLYVDNARYGYDLPSIAVE